MAYGSMFIKCALPTRCRPILLFIVLSLPTGLAITSTIYFLWMIISDGKNTWYPYAEVFLLVLFLTLVWMRHLKEENLHLVKKLCIQKVSVPTALMLLALVFGAVVSFTFSLKLANINPWGGWDAWARINLKARFLFAGGDHWTWIFEGIRIYHHDYPLLLQCTIARLWTWNGGITLNIPQILSVLWGIWSFFILYYVIAWLRSPVMAVIAGLAYLTYTPLLFWSAMQYSDIPLACYMMLACAMMIAVTQFPNHSQNYTFLAGFFAGSAAWCKNEGIVFALLIILWLFFLILRRFLYNPKRATITFIIGFCIIGSSTVLLKLGFAINSDLVTSQLSHYELFVDSMRHKIILEYFGLLAQSYWQGWPLLILALAFALYQYPYRKATNLGALFCTLSMMVIYYAVFVLTPHDLTWHLNTAMNRLVLHIWPILLISLAVLFEDKNKNKPLLKISAGDRPI